MEVDVHRADIRGSDGEIIASLLRKTPDRYEIQFRGGAVIGFLVKTEYPHRTGLWAVQDDPWRKSYSHSGDDLLELAVLHAQDVKNLFA